MHCCILQTGVGWGIDYCPLSGPEEATGSLSRKKEMGVLYVLNPTDFVLLVELGV